MDFVSFGPRPSGLNLITRKVRALWGPDLGYIMPPFGAEFFVQLDACAPRRMFALPPLYGVAADTQIRTKSFILRNSGMDTVLLPADRQSL